MRKVMVSESKLQGAGTEREPRRYATVEKGVANFHCFGVNYAEFEAGPGNYSTAIIEWPDGTVENIPANLVRFLDPAEVAK